MATRKNRQAKVETPKDLVKILRDPKKLAQFATGAVSTDRKAWVGSGFRVLQGVFARNGFRQLGREINAYMNEGRIKEDFLEDVSNQSTLMEILQSIDADLPDEDRLKAMRLIFLRAALSSSDERDRILAHQLVQIVRKLTGAQILILKAAYEIANSEETQKLLKVEEHKINAKKWLEIMAKRMGHGSTSLIEVHEDQLINLHLIGQRLSDGSIAHWGQTCRLTDLGMKLCEFLCRPL